MSDIIILKILGGVFLIFTTLFAFFLRLFLIKIKNLNEYNYAEKLENIKSEIHKSNDILHSLIQDHFFTSQKVFDKRIEGYNTLWSCILELKNNFPGGINFVYRILTDSKIENHETYKDLNNNPKIGPVLQSYDLDEQSMFIINNDNSLISYRPYLSDEVYKLYFTYRALTGRVIREFIWNYRREKIYNWKKDEHLENILKVVLTDEEIRYLHNIKSDSLIKLSDLLEYKILMSIRQDLNIKQSTIDIIESFKEFEEILKKEPSE